jgi:hypothetical protein
MPEIRLGIGREQGSFEGWNREWLYWYDREGNRFEQAERQLEQERQRAEQRAEQAEQQLEQERRLREELIARLRERGIDPDAL